jgi:hypothetical protein
VKPDLDCFGWLADELQAKQLSPQLRLSDFEVPAQRSLMTFNVKQPTVIGLELPLDQK